MFWSYKGGWCRLRHVVATLKSPVHMIHTKANLRVCSFPKPSVHSLNTKFGVSCIPRLWWRRCFSVYRFPRNTDNAQCESVFPDGRATFGSMVTTTPASSEHWWIEESEVSLEMNTKCSDVVNYLQWPLNSPDFNVNPAYDGATVQSHRLSLNQTPIYALTQYMYQNQQHD